MGSAPDHQQHVALAEPHPIKRTLWQRWMAWSGSFLILSILLHILLIAGGAILVVQVVQGRKEKLKFTAPPPSPAGAVEHKVKASKKTAAAAPSISKRIVSTAANASISLPAMDMNSSTGPDVMASVMSGMGGSGLGAGMGASGGAGMAAMPLGGLTAFGFKGKGQLGGLTGTLYDLKQTKDRQPTEIKDDGIFKDRNAEKDNGYRFEAWDRYQKALKDPTQQRLLSEGLLNSAKVINDFFSRGWDSNVLERFYRSPDPLTAYQIAIPRASQDEALNAFGVEKEVKKNRFLIHYKGTVTAPRDGSYRFVVSIDNGMLAIRFDGENIFGDLSPLIRKDFFRDLPYEKNPNLSRGAKPSKWLRLQAGRKYPVEILMTVGGQTVGDGFKCVLQMEEKDPVKPYVPSEFQWQSKQGLQYQTGDALKHPMIYLRLPLFALRKDVPIPSFEMPDTTLPDKMSESATKHWKENGPVVKCPDLAPESLVFPGSK
jgi:ribosomal protein L15